MKNKDNKKQPKLPFIIIYYDVMRDLDIDFESYILLYYLMKISKRNEIGKINISAIEEQLFFVNTKKTLSKKLKNLLEKEHIIENEKGNYSLNPDVLERFTTTGRFLIIYFELLPILKMRIKKYLVLYLTYSLFKKSKNQNGFFDMNTFCECLNIKRTMYFRHRKNLVDEGYIIKQSGTQYRLNSDLYKEFEELRTRYGN